ncbi:Tripartite tricarboxylate transporter TctA family protein [Caballeronia temeraria]|uniref:Tripartite tricarboxylate transporter TctA family protein n=1 Tax=Caballeronia temeraria TaxID=1777137 RepID=A0A157ZZD8_9BURK|nr:tripartite tricarboxylate transporter permease [Caballeronia temeraria]SAK50908.1 Tripartite tricarboxylate transporter TctA family protein [Caballeronia temeraria]
MLDAALVIAIVYLGVFNASQSWGDLCSLVLFGAVGWIMKRLNWPRPPLILGLVLGSIFERYSFGKSMHWLRTGSRTRPIGSSPASTFFISRRSIRR